MSLILRRVFVHLDATLAGVAVAVGLPDPGMGEHHWHLWAARIGAIALGAIGKGIVAPLLGGAKHE